MRFVCFYVSFFFLFFSFSLSLSPSLCCLVSTFFFVFSYNKKQVKARHPNVNWIAKARWIVDGRFWTSSGVSAGMDLTFAWIGAVFGEGVAQAVAERSEYVRNVDSEDDGGFAARWGAV